MPERLEDGRIVYEIYSYNPQTASLGLLYSGGASSNSFGRIAYCDGYIYYAEGFYNEDFDRTSGRVTSGDQYLRFMRIKTSGGKPELLFDEDFGTGTGFDVDAYNFYIFDTDSAALTARSRTDGTMKTIDLGGLSYIDTTVYNGKLYIRCVQESFVTKINAFTLNPISVFSYDPVTEKVATVASDITGEPVLSGGALWYTPIMTDVEYFGTKDMPTGRPGERLPFDYIRFNSGEIVRVDLATGETKAWNAGSDAYGQLEPSIIGWSDGFLLTRFYSTGRNYATGEGDYHVYKLILNDDGTVTVAGEFNFEI